ncbi:MAG: toxin-antitoxin system YwqK family antitoxin [Luteibaculaceae bacterium]
MFKRVISTVVFVYCIVGSTMGQINRTDENGLKQGPWQKIHTDTQRPAYNGFFKDDKPVGTWQYFDKRGKITAELNYIRISDSAQAKIFDEKGGLKAAGLYVNKKKEGMWRFFDDRGKKSSEQMFSNDTPNGVYKVFYLNGVVAEQMEYKNGELDGPWSRFYEDGKPYSSVLYVDGFREGLYKEFFPSGKLLQEGHYVKGNQKGEWNFYLENGRTNRRCIYPENGGQKPDTCLVINGVLEIYNKEEILMATYEMKNGKKHGEFIEYFPDAYWQLNKKPIKDPYGEVVSEEYYRELRDHKIHRKGTYVEGKLSGEVLIYNKKGKVEQKEKYEVVN